MSRFHDALRLIASRSVFIVVAFFFPALFSAYGQKNQLVGSTVLIIRHAEKPASGSSLTPEGFARAQKYAQYFNPFQGSGEAVRLNALYAGADSADSMRPRLTLEPLSRSTGIALNTKFSTDDPEGLARSLQTETHGDHILIAWRHKKIPALLNALGADANQILPEGKWPDSVYDWVVVLHFDAAGHLQAQTLLHEPNPLP